MVDAVRLIGFEHAVVARIEHGEVHLIAGNPHPHWSAHLRENGYLLDLPMCVIRNGRGPMFYTEIERSELASPRILEIAAARRQFGIHEGLVAARFLTEGLFYFTTLLGSKLDLPSPDLRAAAHVLANAVISAAIRVDAQRRDAAPPAVELTERQGE